jgi:hypothetical protein
VVIYMQGSDIDILMYWIYEGVPLEGL